MGRVVVGKSEDVQRIYGQRASHEFTMLEITDGRVSSIEGFCTIDLMDYTLTDDRVCESNLWRIPEGFAGDKFHFV